jgi:hypothetical protein
MKSDLFAILFDELYALTPTGQVNCRRRLLSRCFGHVGHSRTAESRIYCGIRGSYLVWFDVGRAMRNQDPF